MTRLRTVDRRLALAAMLAMVFAGLPAFTGHTRAVLATTLMAADEPSALAEAQSAQQTVMALSDTTEYAQTFVNPDGSFTDYVSPMQQRMQLDDGTWTNIDTTQQTQSDGRWCPRHATEYNWWPGEVSDVCTFFGMLDATQIQNVFSSGCGSAGAP